MTTPTPGDLSARLELVAKRLDPDRSVAAPLVAHLNTFAQITAEVRSIAAALSALPAAGTPSSRWSANGEPDPHGAFYECERAALAHGDMTDDELANAVFLDPNIGHLTAAKDRIRWLSRRLAATTPQPSAAEGLRVNIRCEVQDNGVVGTQYLNVLRVESEDDGSFTAVTDHWPPDAAVGAQGDGVALMREASEVLEAVGTSGVALPENWRWPLVDELYGQAALLSAAPAAGKGVDDLLDLATLYGDHSVDSRNRESWDFDAHGLKQLAAALTRQPVAGDGIRAATPEEEAAIDAALGYTKLTIRLPRDLLAAVGEAAAREGLVRVAMIRALIKRGLSSENTPAEPAQTAPAATPTDGGEG